MWLIVCVFQANSLLPGKVGYTKECIICKAGVVVLMWLNFFLNMFSNSHAHSIS